MTITATFDLPDNTFDSLVTKEYLEKRLKEFLGEVPITIPPAPCDHYPEIKSVTQLSSSSLKVNFYGINITEIKWSLYHGEDYVEGGIFIPINDVPILNLKNTIGLGKYNLLFEATKCSGTGVPFPFNGKIKF